MTDFEESGIDHNAVIEQLQHENEELRVRLTQALKSNPISDQIEGFVVVLQKTDPMRLYIWACIAFMLIMALARLLELFIK